MLYGSKCSAFAVSLSIAYLISTNAIAAEKKSVVVYTARKTQLVEPVFAKFTEKTGIKVEYTTGDDATLIERVASEGKNTSADILMTVDAGSLWRSGEKDLLQEYKSDELNTSIPEHLRDPKSRWWALSLRARTIAYSTKTVDPAKLKNYASLSEPQWKSKVCLRTSKKVYTQSLVASLLAQMGPEATEKMAKGWVDNLAAPVFSSDEDILKAIDAGQCALAIVNSYYFGRLYAKNPGINVRLFWPTKENGGAHVNVSGAGITKYAKHVDNAKKLMVWLASVEAQTMFAEANMEFPANPKAPVSKVIDGWGVFDAMPLNVSESGIKQADAVKLLDRVHYL